MNLEQIEKLNELKEKGMITEEEFQRAKEKILAGEAVSPAPGAATQPAPPRRALHRLRASPRRPGAARRRTSRRPACPARRVR